MTMGTMRPLVPVVRQHAEETAVLRDVRSVLFGAPRVKLISSCCYDATSRGFVGPVGVTESVHGSVVGASLLRACLDEKRAVGYGHAIVGSVGRLSFSGA